MKLTQVQYGGLSLGDAGLQVTYGGLAVGGHVTGGRSNGQFGLDPKGSAASFAWLAGASYAIGPIIFGASYFDFQSAGSKNALDLAAMSGRPATSTASPRAAPTPSLPA